MKSGSSSVTLIGPGGAGKSTVGAAIAERLGMVFIDLDVRFADRAGDISAYINRFGYPAYAQKNIETYSSLLYEGSGPHVAALSSGFMTYPHDVHPEYASLRRRVEHSPTTFVLIPSLDRERCITETVRRQLARPFNRGPAREEAVIRERFLTYVALAAPKIETMRAPSAVVGELLLSIRRAPPTSGRGQTTST